MVREIRRWAKTRFCMGLRKLMCWTMTYKKKKNKSSVSGLRKGGRQAEAKARKMYAVLSEFGENLAVWREKWREKNENSAQRTPVWCW